jgi:hypothetical protein
MLPVVTIIPKHEDDERAVWGPEPARATGALARQQLHAEIQ